MPDRPNVLVVLADQQRWDTVGAYGSPMDLTPNLDASADRGTLLEQAITPQPVCGPARACLQTGQHATTTGVWRNGNVLPDVEHALARTFARHGYDTGYVGKWHLAGTGTDPIPADRRAGYDYWRAADLLEFTSHPYEGVVYDEAGEPVPYDGYRVDALTDVAVEFLDRDRDGPFFLFLSHLEPHHQNDLEAYVAPEGYAHRYRNPWVPPDLRGRPGDWYEELPDYYGICRRLDECHGRLLDELDARGILDETVVAYTSDHGSHFRTRNDEYKRSAHEASIHVPAILQGPGFDGGGRVREPTSLLDLPPTLLDAAGIDPPDPMAGHSLLPSIRGAAPHPRDDVFVQISEAEVGRALRTDRWTYAVHAPEKDGRSDPAADAYVERYLYDRRADPHEAVNLVGRPDYRAVAEELRNRLRARIEAVEGDPAEIEPAEYPA